MAVSGLGNREGGAFAPMLHTGSLVINHESR